MTRQQQKLKRNNGVHHTWNSRYSLKLQVKRSIQKSNKFQENDLDNSGNRTESNASQRITYKQTSQTHRK